MNIEESKKLTNKYGGDISRFFREASQEEQEALILDAVDKANKEQKALMDKYKNI